MVLIFHLEQRLGIRHNCLFQEDQWLVFSQCILTYSMEHLLDMSTVLPPPPPPEVTLHRQTKRSPYGYCAFYTFSQRPHK